MESKIIIKDLQVSCIIGDRDYERTEKQIIFIDLELYFDVKAAIKTDDLSKSVDYYLLAKDVKGFIEKSSYFLIETLAGDIADLVLKNYPLEKVLVRVKKPSALKDAKHVSAEIVKER